MKTPLAALAIVVMLMFGLLVLSGSLMLHGHDRNEEFFKKYPECRGLPYQ